MQQENNENQLNIELSEEIAEGSFSNFVIISHSPDEFVFDFIRVLPGLPKAKVKSRVFMNPQNAKRLLYALNENVQKYEQSFGEITFSNADQQTAPAPMGGFGSQGLA